jgi:hypothetical protein
MMALASWILEHYAAILAVSIVFHGLGIAFLVVLWKLHPGFLKHVMAKLRGKDFVFVMRSDRKMGFLPAEYREGDLHTAMGSFSAEPDDMGVYEGIPTAIAYAPYARSLNPKALVALRKIRRLGIDNYHDLIRILYIDLEKLKEKGEIKEEEAQEILKLRKELGELDGKILNDLEVIRVAKIEREVTDELRKIRNPITRLMPYVFMFMMVMMAAAIAFAIIQTVGGGKGEDQIIKESTTAALKVG